MIDIISCVVSWGRLLIIFINKSIVFNVGDKLVFILKHLLVAEAFSFNHRGIQGCTPEECPGKNLNVGVRI